jgi:hypothetical protein
MPNPHGKGGKKTVAKNFSHSLTSTNFPLAPKKLPNLYTFAGGAQ